jgi:iron complex outermembrane receptor protein
MTTRPRLHLTYLVSLAALAAGIAVPAFAQEVRGPESPNATPAAPSPASTAAQDSAPSSGLADIVVTARKVAENQQNVPVAITAFSGEALQQQGAVVVSDIARLTPGLIITPSTSTQSAAQFTIRGQVQQDNLATLDPSVGLYVDGMYWARAYGINADLLDIADVQTLKGPQGTLFGRNTTGGAILIDTNNPSFSDGISVLASGTYGRFNQWSGTGILNVPLIDDKLAIRVAYGRNTRDGYVTETNTGAKLDSRNEYTARAKLLYKPTDNLTILLSAEQYRSKFLGNPYRQTYVSASSPANVEAGVEGTGGACFAGGVAACFGQGIGLFSQAISKDSNAGSNAVALNYLPSTFAKTDTYSATTTLDTFFGALKAVGGYRKVRASATVDLDGSPYDILATTGRQKLSQYSVEVQATGKAFDNRLDFAAGVFYFHESGYDLSTSTAIPALNPQGTYLSGNIDNDSQGLYGQATYHLTDKLSATGGIRYSVDDKRILALNGNYTPNGLQGPTTGGTFNCSIRTCPEERHADYSGISYTAGLDYQLTPYILGYVKTAKGFRSGGQNLRGISVVGSPIFDQSTASFAPEIATSYEGGLKTEFFDRKLRVNAAGYYTIDKGIQRTTLLSDAFGNTATVLTNAGRADIYGAELEAQALLPFGFRLDGSLAYTHPKYVSYINPTTGFDQSHERFYGIAKWTASISPSWTQDLGFGSLTLRSDVTYQSKTALYNNGYYTDAAGAIHDASNGSVVTAADRAGFLNATTDRSHVLVAARASITAMDDKVEVAVWGKNLTNKRDIVTGLPITGLGEAASIYREPRTIGVTVTLKYNNL